MTGPDDATSAADVEFDISANDTPSDWQIDVVTLSGRRTWAVRV